LSSCAQKRAVSRRFDRADRVPAVGRIRAEARRRWPSRVGSHLAAVGCRAALQLDAGNSGVGEARELAVHASFEQRWSRAQARFWGQTGLAGTLEELEDSVSLEEHGAQAGRVLLTVAITAGAKPKRGPEKSSP